MTRRKKEGERVPTLKASVATLEKEVSTLREVFSGCRGQTDVWAKRYGRLADDYRTLWVVAGGYATPESAKRRVHKNELSLLGMMIGYFGGEDSTVSAT